MQLIHLGEQVGHRCCLVGCSWTTWQVNFHFPGCYTPNPTLIPSFILTCGIKNVSLLSGWAIDKSVSEAAQPLQVLVILQLWSEISDCFSLNYFYRSFSHCCALWFVATFKGHSHGDRHGDSWVCFVITGEWEGFRMPRLIGPAIRIHHLATEWSVMDTRDGNI